LLIERAVEGDNQGTKRKDHWGSQFESGELSLLVSSNRVEKRDQRGKRGERGRAAASGRQNA
jgi:hypothetical protein